MSITSDRLREHFNHDVTDSAANEIDELEHQITKLREQVAAQAAVIEKLREGYTDCLTSRDADERDWAEYYLTTTTDSTQILDEVRRAERERCAIVAEKHNDYYGNSREISGKIRAME